MKHIRAFVKSSLQLDSGTKRRSRLGVDDRLEVSRGDEHFTGHAVNSSQSRMISGVSEK